MNEQQVRDGESVGSVQQASDGVTPGGTKPTIKTVAARAGVSKSLVSLVLQGSPRVAEATREHVLHVMQELDYRPNAAARSLAQRRTQSIGVLASNIFSPWHADFMLGFSPIMDAHQMRVLLGHAHNSRSTAAGIIDLFVESRIEGMVVLGTLPFPDVLGTAVQSIPAVIAGTQDEMFDADLVSNDDAVGAELATNHLVDLGHRSIGHIAAHGVVGQIRRQSFERVLSAHDLRPAAIEGSDFSEEGGYRAAIRLLVRPEKRPTAIFAYNDMTCLGALTAAAELGISVPDELSLVGYDNSYVSRIRHIWMTTVDISAEDLGRTAGSLILRRIEEGMYPHERHLVSPRLVVRGTTAPPP